MDDVNGTSGPRAPAVLSHEEHMGIGVYLLITGTPLLGMSHPRHSTYQNVTFLLPWSISVISHDASSLA